MNQNYIDAANNCRQVEGCCGDCRFKKSQCPFSKYASYEEPIKAIVDFVYNIETTRLIESIDHDYWKCEQCGELWIFNEGTPEENNYRYCCNCGRKISNYIGYPEDYE